MSAYRPTVYPTESSNHVKLPCESEMLQNLISSFLTHAFIMLIGLVVFVQFCFMGKQTKNDHTKTSSLASNLITV